MKGSETEETPTQEYRSKRFARGVCGTPKCTNSVDPDGEHKLCWPCRFALAEHVKDVRAERVARGRCRCDNPKPSGVKRCWHCVDNEQQAAMRKANDKYGVADLVPWFAKQYDYKGFVASTEAGA